MSTETPDIVLRGLTKRYGDVTAVDAIDLTVTRYERHYRRLLSEPTVGEGRSA